MLEAQPINPSSPEATEEIPPARLCFPTFTMLAVLGLLIMAGISWMRHRHDDQQTLAPQLETIFPGK